jgi:hypothetical protein
MKDKAFARTVDREDIIHGAEQLGLPLDTDIAEVITALKLDAERLGLAEPHIQLSPEIERDRQGCAFRVFRQQSPTPTA